MDGDKKTAHNGYKFEDGCLTVKIDGEIDHHSAKTIREAVDELIFDYRPRALYLDFADVEFMDSSGLGLIMGRYKLMKLYSGKTYVKNPAHRIMRIIELAGMNRIIEIIYDENEEGGECNEKN